MEKLASSWRNIKDLLDCKHETWNRMFRSLQLRAYVLIIINLGALFTLTISQAINNLLLFNCCNNSTSRVKYVDTGVLITCFSRKVFKLDLITYTRYFRNKYTKILLINQKWECFFLKYNFYLNWNKTKKCIF